MPFTRFSGYILPRRLAATALLAGLALCLGACSVPKHMQVRSGIHPDNQDEQVRFRTIYYFKVKDPCQTAGSQQDSLYRFRMTGKASALMTKIRFESGTLRAEQIDPFGQSVSHDFKTKTTLAPVTPPQVQKGTTAEQTHLTAIAGELKALRAELGREETWTKEEALKKNLEALQSIKPRMEAVKAATKARGDLTDAALADLAGTLTPNDLPAAKKAKTRIKGRLDDLIADLENRLPARAPKAPEPDKCKNKGLEQMGFQIWGPQGWVTFDQDQRLLMAMTTSAKPLISVLQEYSARILGTEGSNRDVLIPLEQEELMLYKAKVKLGDEKGEAGITAVQLAENVISAFEGKGEEK